MNYSTVDILKIPFINVTKKEMTMKIIAYHMKKNHKIFIVTANPEIVMKTREDSHYKEVLLDADYIVPDGIGIIISSKLKGVALKERIAGFDLVIDMLDIANEKGKSCYFLGAKDENLEQAMKNVKETYPHLKIVGYHDGYFKNDKEIVSKIQKEKPDFVFVALGFPKQEYWIHKNLPQFEKGIFIGVGGTIDVLSGNVKRAPNIWIKLHLEWLYRALKEPFRIKRLFPIVRFMMLSVFRKQ